MSRLTSVFVALVAVFVVLGLYLGWVNFTAERSPDKQKVDLNVHVDVGKIKADTRTAVDKTKELGEEVKDRVGSAKEHAGSSVKEEQVQGKVNSLDEAGSSFTVITSTAEPVTIHLEPGAKLQLNGKTATFKDLQMGDRVTVTCHTTNGQHWGIRLAIDRPT